jgi:hypothetical protein
MYADQRLALIAACTTAVWCVYGTSEITRLCAATATLSVVGSATATLRMRGDARGRGDACGRRS